MKNAFHNAIERNVGRHSFFRDRTVSQRNLVSDEQVVVPSTMPRILLVDDDPLFGMIMQRVASNKGASLKYCKNIEEFAKQKSVDFDVVLMDYDLGSVTGLELTQYLEEFLGARVPVILISQTDRVSPKGWPESIREFVHKGFGPLGILDAAFEAHEVNQIHKKRSHLRAL